MQANIVDAFHATSLLKRADIFHDDRLMPITAPEDAKTPAPGWVGRNWQLGNVLMIAINPGGGGDRYRRNATDDELYTCLRRFRDAAEPDREQALIDLSDCWTRIQQTHNIFRLMHAVLDAAELNEQQTAFINILPFRTREDKPARSAELTRAWEAATKKQVESLAPSKIVALGSKAYEALRRAGATEQFDVVLLKRAIGDSYITSQAQEAIESLRPHG